MNRGIIEQYEQAAGKLRQAIAGLSREELLARPDAQSWSIQQIVLHLMDSDLIWTERAKRMIAEENPTLMAFDESRFAERLGYDEQSAEDAVRIFELNRKMFARVLRKLDDATFQRTGEHSERGTIRLGESLESIVRHVEHHLEHLLEKRAKVAKTRTE